MNRTISLVTFLAALILLVLGTLPIIAQDIDDTGRRHTLVGLKQVVVGVATQDKLDSAEFKIQAELRLRTAGIPVGSDPKAWLTDSSTTLLLFNVSTLAGPPSVWTLHTSLMQAVCLRRDISICTTSETWEADGQFGFGSAASIHDTLLEIVRKHADQFANAFLAANPKR